MTDTFRQWLALELQNRRWSQRAFAQHSGVSQPLLSQILAGKVNVTPAVCLKLAAVLDQPPDKLFRLAGLQPPIAPEDDTLTELTGLIKLLSPSRRAEVLRYIRFLLSQ